MTTANRLTRDDFLAYEEQIASDPRGRAYLRWRERQSRVVAADQVRRMFLQYLVLPTRSNGASEQISDHVRILRQELQEMSGYIAQTRREIAALRPDDRGNNRIMSATGELDAIVSATERATTEILKGAENIQVAASRLPTEGEVAAIRKEIEKQVIEIMTACSFQDITGQRTSKVVNTLRYIETRVNSMIEIWGVDGVVTAAMIPSDDKRPDAHLLNGPALEGGVSQDDVDALLAEQTGPAFRPAANIDQQDIDALFN